VDSERVPIPRLTSRSALAWAVGTLVVLVVVMAVLALVQSSYAVPAVVVAVLAVLVAVAVGTRRLWLEPVSGRFVVQRLGVLRRAAELRDARSVALVDNRAGGLNLTVTPASGRAVLVPVLLLSDQVQASQPAPLLRLLADQVETHRTGGAGEQGDTDVPAALRAQAAHLEAGGSAVDSPLAASVTRGVLRAAQGGAAAGGGSSLLD
jgi:hypothetical protein